MALDASILLVISAFVAVGFAFAAGVLVYRRNIVGWLPNYLRQDWRARVPPETTKHLLFCFVDHFEPRWLGAAYDVECRRVARWREGYPTICDGHVDSDGYPPVHSFFFPEEEYRPEHIDALVDLCRLRLGEIDVHLHHHDDTESGLREKLSKFTSLLADRHDALPRDAKTGQTRWGFIHGNWALDNSHPDGLYCGVNNELIILREEGCYADFTYPSAPDPCQTREINSIYYATDDPHHPKSHDRGTRVRVGGERVGDLMLIQGPLGFNWKRRKFGIFPRIENGDVRSNAPPTPDRIDAWVKTGIHVQGRPDWIFVKVHTHGTQERDFETLLGAPMELAFSHLESKYNDGVYWKLHYVSAREMYNIAKAAEAGHDGNPSQYRDFELCRPSFHRMTRDSCG